MKKHIYLSFLLSFTLTIQAQKTVLITKAALLLKVSENNIAIKISEQEFNKAKADYNQTNAMFLSNISASYTGISKTNPLMAFGSYEIYDNNVFQGDANGYVIGAQLSWDIFQGSKCFGMAQKSKA
jgi:outer membrane protein TolC